jgi:hypothetical protein
MEHIDSSKTFVLKALARSVRWPTDRGGAQSHTTTTELRAMVSLLDLCQCEKSTKV